MRFLVSIYPDHERCNELDNSGKATDLIDWLREEFEPEVIYLEAARRKIWMVVELASAARLNNLTCVGAHRLGCYPEFRPIFTAEESKTAIPASLALRERIP